MKYYSTGKKSSSAGFYLVIALCLLTIGAAVWFALSRVQSIKKEQNDPSPAPSSSQPMPSIPAPADDTPENPVPAPATDVNDSVSDIPYESKPQETVVEEGFIYPVEGEILKDFSDSALQFSATYGDMRIHDGIDLACTENTAVKAAGGGTVTATDESASLGKTVTVDHGNGLLVRYCGFSSVEVGVGQKVNAGTPLGTSGTVPGECADAPHIHVEATLDGKPVSLTKVKDLQK